MYYYFKLLRHIIANQDGLEVGLAVIIALVVGVAIGLIFHSMEKARTNKIKSIFKDMGLVVSEIPNKHVFQQLKNYPLMDIGRGKRFKNLVSIDTPQAQLKMFDYRYIISNGEHSTCHKQTVLEVTSEFLNLPVFNLRREGMWDKVASIFGGQDIDFSDHPAFSEKFILKGTSEQEIRVFMDPTLLDFFASQPSMCFETQPGSFIFYKHKFRVGATSTEIQRFIEQAIAVLEAFTTRQSRPMSSTP